LLAVLVSGKVIEKLPCYAVAVMHSVVRQMLSQIHVKEADASDVVQENRLATFDDLVSRPRKLPQALRGAVQKQLVEGVCTGLDLVTISEGLKLSVRETKRRMLRLAEKIHGQRKSTMNLQPHHHTQTPSE
jgi:hypothetical protein